MEDMDTQLRSQLEKFISERNQLSAEKAARDIEVRSQHSTQPISWHCHNGSYVCQVWLFYASRNCCKSATKFSHKPQGACVSCKELCFVASVTRVRTYVADLLYM